MKTILIATANLAKARRLRAICDGLPLEPVSPADLFGAAPQLDIPEEGGTHLAVATRKAVEWSRRCEAPAIASDGGLAIPALGERWDSLLTKRATGDVHATDEERAGRLLRMMRRLEGEERRAFWIEGVAVAQGGELIGAYEASGLEGRIAGNFVAPPEGTGGFWAAGLWVSEASGKRYWQLAERELVDERDPWSQLASPVRDLLAGLV